MRAKGLSSPDFADALMMAVWLWKMRKPTDMRVKRFNKNILIESSYVFLKHLKCRKNKNKFYPK